MNTAEIFPKVERYSVIKLIKLLFSLFEIQHYEAIIQREFIGHMSSKNNNPLNAASSLLEYIVPGIFHL